MQKQVLMELPVAVRSVTVVWTHHKISCRLKPRMARNNVMIPNGSTWLHTTGMLWYCPRCSLKHQWFLQFHYNNIKKVVEKIYPHLYKMTWLLIYYLHDNYLFVTIFITYHYLLIVLSVSHRLCICCSFHLTFYRLHMQERLFWGGGLYG